MSKMSAMKRLLLITLFLFLADLTFGQEILTASQFFDSISSGYGTVKDYTARLSITAKDTEMEGTLFYRSPNLLRINFSNPKDQVINVDGETLTIYIPDQNVVMVQQLKKHNDASLAVMANEKGLQLLKKGYSVAYLKGPEPIPLDEGSKEMVVKLNLVWRGTDEGYRQIIMSVTEDGLIRRMKGITINYETFQYDFTEVRINQDLPDTRFKYDPPPSAYMMKNFLFEPEP